MKIVMAHKYLLMMIVSSMTVAHVGSEDCQYRCTSRGGCSVRYVGPFRSGAQAGYCFSPSSGGRCRGTPPECQQCDKAINCRSNSGNFGGGFGAPGGSGSISSGNCKYYCTPGGGCEVRYVGPPRNGKSLGSCTAGGSCNRAPSGCKQCNLEITCKSEGGYKGDSDGGKKDESDGGKTDCKYSCSYGGCTVSYVGPPRVGPSSGYCYSKSGGGRCVGTPPECKNCNQAINCSTNFPNFDKNLKREGGQASVVLHTIRRGDRGNIDDILPNVKITGSGPIIN